MKVVKLQTFQSKEKLQGPNLKNERQIKKKSKSESQSNLIERKKSCNKEYLLN